MAATQLTTNVIGATHDPSLSEGLILVSDHGQNAKCNSWRKLNDSYADTSQTL